MDNAAIKPDRLPDCDQDGAALPMPMSTQGVNSQSLGSAWAPAQERQFSEDPDVAAWELLSRLTDLRFKRHEWLMQNRTILLSGWHLYALEYQRWRHEVDQQIRVLHTLGKGDGARRLVELISKDPNAHDPGDFRLSMITGENLETISFQSTPLHSLGSSHDQQHGQPTQADSWSMTEFYCALVLPTSIFVTMSANDGSKPDCLTGPAAPKQGGTPKQLHDANRTNVKKIRADIRKLSEACEYRDFTVEQLREACASKNIEHGRRSNRKTLIYALVRNDNFE